MLRGSLCYFRQMDKRITRYNALKAMKSDEYRSWQRLPGSERIRAVVDLNLDLYAMKGQAADAPRTLPSQITSFGWARRQ